jgi:hypothetical protein
MQKMSQKCKIVYLFTTPGKAITRVVYELLRVRFRVATRNAAFRRVNCAVITRPKKRSP